MLAPRRRSLGYLKAHCDVTERWQLAWNQNKKIIYYIVHILIPKLVLVFRKMQIPKPFHFHAALLNCLVLSKLSNNIKEPHQKFEKKDACKYRELN